MVNWTVVAVVVNVVVLICGGVWAVGIINSTGLVLNETIRNLTLQVSRLEGALGHMEKRTLDHEIRLTKMEAK